MNNLSIPWKWRDVGITVLWTIGGVILGVAVAVAALASSGGLDQRTDVQSQPPIWIFVLISTIVYGIVIWATYRRTVLRYQVNWSSLGVRRFASSWIFLLPFLLLVQLMAAGAVNLLFIAPFMGGEFENPQIDLITGGEPVASSDFLPLFFALAILAPIAEELFFRGMMYPLLRQRFTMWVAIFLNAAVFSLIHLIPVLLPALFVIGLMLAWVREKSGSVIPCILLHMLQNGLAVVSIYLLIA